MNRMNLDRFRQLLDIHGSDLARWPSAEGAEAAELAQLDAQVRAMLEGSRRLEQAWSDTRGEASHVALRQRILDALPDQGRKPARAARPLLGMLIEELGGWRVAGPAFAGALTLGIALGFGLNDSSAFDLVELAVSSDIDVDY